MLSYDNSFCKSTWVKKKNFTQVEKHIQIFAMFRDSATVKFCIYKKFKLQK